MTQSIVSAIAGVLLLVAGPARAITVSGLNPNSVSYLVSASAAGGEYSGVPELMIVRSDPGGPITERCPGALLSDGFSILTAAHCVADRDGLDATAAYATFSLPGDTYRSGVIKFEVDPLYDGKAESPNDVAVLQLAAPAPEAVTRYQLFDDDTAGQFDDGSTARDALGGSIGHSSGEVLMAPGDSGVLDGSFGGNDGDVVAVYDAAFIQSLIGSAPEPRTMFLVGVALVAFSLMGTRTRRQ